MPGRKRSSRGSYTPRAGLNRGRTYGSVTSGGNTPLNTSTTNFDGRGDQNLGNSVSGFHERRNINTRGLPLKRKFVAEEIGFASATGNSNSFQCPEGSRQNPVLIDDSESALNISGSLSRIIPHGQTSAHAAVSGNKSFTTLEGNVLRLSADRQFVLGWKMGIILHITRLQIFPISTVLSIAEGLEISLSEIYGENLVEGMAEARRREERRNKLLRSCGSIDTNVTQNQSTPVQDADSSHWQNSVSAASREGTQLSTRSRRKQQSQPRKAAAPSCPQYPVSATTQHRNLPAPGPVAAGGDRSVRISEARSTFDSLQGHPRLVTPPSHIGGTNRESANNNGQQTQVSLGSGAPMQAAAPSCRRNSLSATTSGRNASRRRHDLPVPNPSPSPRAAGNNKTLRISEVRSALGSPWAEEESDEDEDTMMLALSEDSDMDAETELPEDSDTDAETDLPEDSDMNEETDDDEGFDVDFITDKVGNHNLFTQSSVSKVHVLPPAVPAVAARRQLSVSGRKGRGAQLQDVAYSRWQNSPSATTCQRNQPAHKWTASQTRCTSSVPNSSLTPVAVGNHTSWPSRVAAVNGTSGRASKVVRALDSMWNEDAEDEDMDESEDVEEHEVDESEDFEDHEVDESKDFEDHEVDESEDVEEHKVDELEDFEDHEVGESEDFEGHEVEESEDFEGHEVEESGDVEEHEVYESEDVEEHEVDQSEDVEEHEESIEPDIDSETDEYNDEGVDVDIMTHEDTTMLDVSEDVEEQQEDIQPETNSETEDELNDMRFDVDNMTYEQLLELEERIGNVNTGLSEDCIFKCLKQRKFAPSEEEIQPCTVCQEEFNEDDTVGSLRCGHTFHPECIKHWLMLKKLCPVCKSATEASQ